MSPYALIINNLVVNLIIADSTFISSIIEQYDAIVDCQSIPGLIQIGYLYNTTTGIFSVRPLSDDELATAVILTRKNGIKKRMKYGAKVIEDFRYLTLDLPDDVGPSLIGAFSETIALLNLGMLAAAALALNSIEGIDMINAPYDSSYPEGPTVKQAFVAYILEGDSD